MKNLKEFELKEMYNKLLLYSKSAQTRMECDLYTDAKAAIRALAAIAEG